MFLCVLSVSKSCRQEKGFVRTATWFRDVFKVYLF